jgi:hypothetical protein
MIGRLLACVMALLVCAATPALADRNIAFVVGNASYEKAGALANAKRDAAAVADRLRDLGFEVTEVFDGDAFTLNRAADRFVTQAHNADLALFYFAGHGIQLFDQNFLLARDVDPNKITQVGDLGLDLTSFMTRLRASGAVRVALLIDACRNNPFAFEETVRLVDLVRKAGGKPDAAADGSAGTRGLARVVLVEPNKQRADGNAETLFFFAAQPGQVSFDGAGQNSYFVEGLREELSKKGRPLTEVFRNVSAYVRTVTKGEQVPQVVSDWTGDVVLGGGAIERVAYQVISSNDDKPLSKDERDLVLRSANGFSKFSGDFIAKAGIGDLPSGDMSDADKARAQKLGLVQGFGIDYDLDRDGRDETLGVHFQQTGYWLTLKSQGIVAQIASCFDGDTPNAVEVALKDINGDRKPEVFVAYETESTTGWGKFCILEFKGVPNLAERRRASTGSINLGFEAFRTLLRGESGWGVSIANDNTIKACGGSNCHSSWTYSFDGEKFRLVDVSGEKPGGAAALPFADERERAANLYSAFTRHGGPLLTSQGWRMSRKGDGVTVSARIGSRTEIAYECSKNSVGTIAYESLDLRDKPASDASGGSEIEIEPTLAYGENADKAPMLLDGKACGPMSIGTGSDGGLIQLQSADDQKSGCFEGLARAKIATLPLLHQNALLRVRLDGGAQMLAQARASCGGRLASASAVVRPNERATPPASAPSDKSGPLDARARQFLEDYMKRTEAETEQVLSYVRNNFGAEIRYYGKVTPLSQVVQDKRSYLNRWPQRSYRLKPDTMKIECDEARSICLLTGELDYDVRDPRAGRASSGSATYEVRVVFSPAGPKIVEENGRTLARRN